MVVHPPTVSCLSVPIKAGKGTFVGVNKLHTHSWGRQVVSQGGAGRLGGGGGEKAWAGSQPPLACLGARSAACLPLKPLPSCLGSHWVQVHHCPPPPSPPAMFLSVGRLPSQGRSPPTTGGNGWGWGKGWGLLPSPGLPLLRHVRGSPWEVCLGEACLPGGWGGVGSLRGLPVHLPTTMPVLSQGSCPPAGMGTFPLPTPKQGQGKGSSSNQAVLPAFLPSKGKAKACLG